MNASQSLLDNVLGHGMHIPLMWHSSFPSHITIQCLLGHCTTRKQAQSTQWKLRWGIYQSYRPPTSDLDTLNRVVQRAPHVAKSVDQQHIVLTVDEALCPKLLELKWSAEEYRDVLIPCLSGLHISMNYLGVKGRHMSDSGLSVLWVECDILGANVAQNAMSGQRVCTCHQDTQTKSAISFGNCYSHDSMQTWEVLI